MIINCHTHIGDAFVKLPKVKLSVKEMVAPPHGYKHRMMQMANPKEILSGMETSIKIIKMSNTDVFVDFREGGLKGLYLLKKALNTWETNAIILSRPETMTYNEKEIEELLDYSHGIGISSISDWNYEELSLISSHVNERKKIFASICLG